MSLEGSIVPSTLLFEKSPENKVKLTDLFHNKKGILIGVAGAFTPNCSTSHLPGFINNYEELRSKGYDTIVCVSVNDPYTTEAWAQQCGASGKVRVLADPMAEFTRAIKMDKDFPTLGLRSKRFTALIENNVFRKVFVEPDGMGVSVSSVDNVMKYL